ncbi:hypothetical protein [Undibacterium sp.]|uniref:hypothetical protein n=1 Tax=Undibacterium sp. TaxID=1914977 RepID=UPI003751742A
MLKLLRVSPVGIANTVKRNRSAGIHMLNLLLWRHKTVLIARKPWTQSGTEMLLE